VKVRFSLVQDEDGWPPVSSEGVWAEPLGGDHYRIDNTPWFTRNLSVDDVVEAVAGDDGLLWATRRVSHGGRLTVRVIPLRDGPLQDLQAVLDAFEDLDVTGEGAAPAYRIVALDISPDADLAAVKARLRRGEADGSWAYEEGGISDAWRSL
jgi:hypothetical protein